MRTRALLILVALSLLLPAAAWAQKGPKDGRGPGHMGPPSPEMIAERAAEAGIEEGVVEQILGIMEANKENAEMLRTELQAAHEELRALLEAEVPDRDAVMQQLEAVGAMETDMRKQHLSVELEIRALLTAEQWEAFRPPMGPHMRGGGPGGPGGPDGPPPGDCPRDR